LKLTQKYRLIREFISRYRSAGLDHNPLIATAIIRLVEESRLLLSNRDQDLAFVFLTKLKVARHNKALNAVYGALRRA